MLEALYHGVAATMLSQRKLRLTPADIDRVHDLVGLTMFQDPILMDTRSMSESVLAYDRLTPGYRESAHAADQSRGLHDLLIVQIGVITAVKVLSGFQCHHDFFQSNVAGALADTIDGPLDLPSAGPNRCERICD